MNPFAIAAAIVISTLFCVPLPAQGPAQRVTSGLDGAEPDLLSTDPVLSTDGRFVAFQSYASNLVPNDTNGCADVFVTDRVARTTVRVSVSSAGGQGDHWSGEPAISPDGRYVVFRSDATNLVAGDSNGFADVFIFDRILGRTHRVSTGPGGAQPNGASGRPSVSADGRYVAFESEAANLVPEDKNGTRDVFIRDRNELVTTRVSPCHAGEGDGPSGAPCISADGRLVAFTSSAAKFADEAGIDPDVFLWDVRAKKLTLLSADASGAAAGGESPAISRDGTVVIFESAARLRAADTNPDRDVYSWRVAAKQLSVASVGSTGVPGRSSESAPDFGPPTRIPADSTGASISADGRYVAFVSLARGLVAGDAGGPQVYVRDLVRGTTRCVTMEAGAARESAIDPVLGCIDCCLHAQISGNGLLVGVQTPLAFLAADRNGSDDIYVVSAAPSEASARVQGERKTEQGISVR